MSNKDKKDYDGQWKPDEWAIRAARLMKVKLGRVIVDLNRVDRKQSRLNIARLDMANDGVDSEAAHRMADDMGRGDVFPMPTVFEFPDGSEYEFGFAGGNHRDEASLIRGYKRIPCHLVKLPTAEHIYIFAAHMNMCHGNGPNTELRLQLAIHMLGRGMFTKKQVAAVCGIKPGRLHSRLVGDITRKAVGLAGSSAVLSDSQSAAIKCFDDQPAVLAAISDWIGLPAKKTIEDIKELVRKVRRAKSEVAKLSIIEAMLKKGRRKVDGDKPDPVPLAKTIKLRRSIKATLTLLREAKTVKGAGYAKGAPDHIEDGELFNDLYKAGRRVYPGSNTGPAK